MHSLLCSVLLAASLANVYAAIGPIADLTVANFDIAPDGYTRSYVTCSLALCVLTDLRPLCSASLVDGVFPGPLITGTKVNHSGRFFGYLFLNLHSLGRHLWAQRLGCLDRQYHGLGDLHRKDFFFLPSFVVAGHISYAAALAWYIPTRYQLRRRWCFRQSMPPCTQRGLPLSIQRTGSNGVNPSISG
jgi:hypothetical protein